MQNTEVATQQTARPASRMDTAYKAALALWLAVNAVQVAVYLAIAAGTGSLDTPWFLWTMAIGGAIVATLRYARTHPISTWIK